MLVFASIDAEMSHRADITLARLLFSQQPQPDIRRKLLSSYTRRRFEATRRYRVKSVKNNNLFSSNYWLKLKSYVCAIKKRSLLSIVQTVSRQEYWLEAIT